MPELVGVRERVVEPVLVLVLAEELVEVQVREQALAVLELVQVVVLAEVVEEQLVEPVLVVAVVVPEVVQVAEQEELPHPSL